MHHESTLCEAGQRCETAAAMVIRVNEFRNRTRADAAKRSAHSAGIFVANFGAVAHMCASDGSPCTSSADCNGPPGPAGADYCSRRAGASFHAEPHGEQVTA